MALNRGATAGLYPPGREWNLCAALSYFADVVYKAGSKIDFPACGTIPKLYFLLEIKKKGYISEIFWGKRIQERDQFGKNVVFK